LKPASDLDFDELSIFSLTDTAKAAAERVRRNRKVRLTPTAS
jgi:hypothetical protein